MKECWYCEIADEGKVRFYSLQVGATTHYRTVCDRCRKTRGVDMGFTVEISEAFYMQNVVVRSIMEG